MANILAKLGAGIFAFLMHRAITFRVKEQEGVLGQAVRYFLLLALNVPLASAILVALLVFISHLVVAKLLADIMCVGLTYVFSKHLIFVSKG
jgi:putative flippase GtrA